MCFACRFLALIASLLVPVIALAQTHGFLEQLGTSLQGANAGYALLLVFAGGLLSSFTPCVYPLIPITLSLFGAAGDVTRTRGFLLSLCYVLGIASTYTALGLLSALTGTVFGTFLGDPWVVSVIAVLLVGLSLATLDIWTFRLGGATQRFAQSVGGAGFRGAFGMGLVSGVVAAPCVGPVLVAILIVASASPNPAWGGALLFAYSMGLGLPFLVLGTYSGLLAKLPRSGPWLGGVKFLLASATLAIAIFFVLPQLARVGISAPHLGPLINTSVVMVALVAGLWASRQHQKFITLPAALALAFFGHMLVFNGGSHVGEQVTVTDTGVVTPRWQSTLSGALEEARSRETFAMVDLYADWCAACKELDRFTFANAEVQRELSRHALGRIDFTTESEETTAIAGRYSVIGLPAILFLKPDGSEIPNTRISGFMPPKSFLEHLEAARVGFNN